MMDKIENVTHKLKHVMFSLKKIIEFVRIVVYALARSQFARFNLLSPLNVIWGKKVHLGNFESWVSWKAECSQLSFKTNLKSIE